MVDPMQMDVAILPQLHSLMLSATGGLATALNYPAMVGYGAIVYSR